MNPDPSPQQPGLVRAVGLPGATLLGLGSILGTGVFVSLAFGAQVAGPAVILAVALASLVALANALSSAQLAGAYPVSGGTYEYGYRVLSPSLGFAAGWMFLVAKSASAATAALGFAGYTVYLFRIPGDAARLSLALGAVGVFTVLVCAGVKRTLAVNAVIVSITLLSLFAFVAFLAPHFNASLIGSVQSLYTPPQGPGALFHATALMFVAFTGYGRIATLGEEVQDPARTIPRAIIATLVVSALLYAAVATVAVGVVGAAGVGAVLGGAGAPLEAIATGVSGKPLGVVVAVGAITAMLGVLLNLVLGLSRVVLAMARRRDLPVPLSRVTLAGSPAWAVIAVGVAVALITAIGSFTLAWSLSAFTVLVYYSITNLAAIRLPRESRRFPVWIAYAGLIACLSLAFWVEPSAWVTGLVLLAVGFLVRAMVRWFSGRSAHRSE